MTKEDAEKIVSQVCALFKGNLAGHTQIQEALKVLKDTVKVNKSEEA